MTGQTRHKPTLRTSTRQGMATGDASEVVRYARLSKARGVTKN